MNNPTDNRCPLCGAVITFSPEQQMWVCSYCSNKCSIDDLSNNNLNTNINVVDNVDEVDQFLPEITIGNVDVYRCNACGSQVLATETVMIKSCVYCGSLDITKERIINSKAPDYVIPFKTTKEDAIREYKKSMKGKLLIPSMFRSTQTLDKFVGLYIPFWAYDLEANGEVEFEASDIKYFKDSKYKYKKVERFSVRKSGHFDFLKVLADASTRFPDELIDSLEPYDYNEMQKYSQSHLNGFAVEKFDINEMQGLNMVTGKAKATAVEIMQKTVGHEEQIIVNNGIRVSSRYTHYLLLPVWLLNVKKKDKVYTFAVNGQTGKIVGSFPIGVKEIIKWSTIFFVILFVIGFIFVWIVL